MVMRNRLSPGDGEEAQWDDRGVIVRSVKGRATPDDEGWGRRYNDLSFAVLSQGVVGRSTPL